MHDPLDILAKIHHEDPWKHLDSKTYEGKTYHYYQTCTDPGLQQAYIVAALEMDGNLATGQYHASNMPERISAVQDEIIQRLFANFYGAVVAVTKDYDLGKEGYILWINSKAYQDANEGAWTDREDVSFYDQHLIDTLKKNYGVEVDTPSENAIFYFPKLTAQVEKFVGYITFNQDLLDGVVDNDPNEACTAVPWPHPVKTQTAKVNTTAIDGGGVVLNNTESIKKFMDEYLNDAPIPDHCKNGKDWRRLSKYKTGINDAREFSCKKQDNLLITVITDPNDRLVEVIASWEIFKAGFKI